MMSPACPELEDLQQAPVVLSISSCAHGLRPMKVWISLSETIISYDSGVSLGIVHQSPLHKDTD